MASEHPPALSAATAALRQAGVTSPRLEAELLLCHLLATDRIALLREPDPALTPEQAEAFKALVARRVQREPLPYLTGRQPFLDFELLVDSRVLIPRPETELLVEVGLRLLPQPCPERVRVIDIGAGSGAVSIGIARARPDVKIAATDISGEALQVAATNLARLVEDRQADRVRLFQGACLDPAPEAWRGSVRLIVSNPPYIPAGIIPALQPEVATYEPRVALDGGADGLDVIREILDRSPGWLARGGAVAMEIGEGQAPAVRTLLTEAGFGGIETHRDLAGIERVIVGRWKPDPRAGTALQATL